MARKKSSSELEHLRGENRALKSQVRHLKKEIGRKVKREHQYNDLEDRVAEEYAEELQRENKAISKEVCPECDGSLDMLELGNRIIINCTECTYRTSKKI